MSRNRFSEQAGGLAALCVRRPMLTVVLNLLLILAGAAALLGVEVRELPSVDRPVVSVRASYPGASPQSVDAQVTALLEGAVARLPGVTSISASSSQGSSRVVIEFAPESDIDVAANDVRDAVAGVQRRLPDDVDPPTVVKADDDGQAIMRLAITSERQPIDSLSQRVDDEIVPRLAAVPGVADVSVYGLRSPIMSVVLDTAAMAARGLTVQDVAAVLEAASLDRPAGTLSTAHLDLLIRADASARTAEEIAAIRIDEATRLGDIAQVGERPERRQSSIRFNGAEGIGLSIVRQAGSNTLAISRAVHTAVAELNAGLPSDIAISVTSDDAVFIEGAISEVVATLLMATAIVVAVIWLFLGSLRATLVPAVAVPVALTATLGAIWLMGFSVNLLTLLALVLATGLVVDDAIVVVENIARRRGEGMGPRAAAVLGTREVFFAVIATTATLAAVFLPISFLPGTAGGLFAEFGFVLAFAVALSSLVALTLVPMLAARLPAASGNGAGVGTWLQTAGGLFARLYARALDLCLKAPLVVLTAVGLFAAFAAYQARDLPEELTPREDRGLLMVSISGPQGVNLEYTESKIRQAEDAVLSLVQSGEAESTFTISGNGGGSSGMVIARLAPWEERSRSQQVIMQEVLKDLNDITGVQIGLYSSNSLGIRGGGSGLNFALTGTDYTRLAEAADVFLEDMTARLPGLLDPRLSYDTTQAQLSLAVDRERAADLGVSPGSLAFVIQTLLDGVEAGRIFRDDLDIPIWMEGSRQAILSPADLENVQIRTDAGAVVPLSAVASLEEGAVAPSLSREGQRRAVPLSASLAGDYDMRSAMDDLSALAAETLPPGIGLIFLGEAATLDETGQGFLLTAGFAVLIVLLVLAAQFESLVSAAVILLTVPFALAAAGLAILVTGGSLNIYSQIGLIMLLGLMAKNGILIVEFADQLRDRGATVEAAIRDASAIRLRPVMMTMISTVLGGLPLILTAGPGAEARQALGWIVVGGLGFSTLFTLFLTPVLYRLLAGFARPRANEAQRLEEELTAAESANLKP